MCAVTFSDCRYKIMEHEIVGKCGTYRGNKCVQGWLMNSETRDQLEDLALNGKIIFKRATRKRLEKHGTSLVQTDTG